MILSDGVKSILDRLKQNGIEAYVVGGAVRDSLLGVAPNDYDVTSSAPPEVIKTLFDRVIPTGEKFGTVTVIEKGESVEITRFRSEDGYEDCRHPNRVTPAKSIESDLVRRDFTVNAMAYGIDRGIVDICGGREDLKSGIIRTVGEAHKRFSEDALRIMRAYRFASALGFEIEESTRTAAKELCGSLSKVSRERIQAELVKLLAGKHPSVIGELINAGGLTEYFGSHCDESVKLADNENADLPERFMILVLSCGSSDFENTAKKLRFTNDFCKKVSETENLMYYDFDSRKNIKIALSKYSVDAVKSALNLQKDYFGKDTKNALSVLCEIIDGGEPYKLCRLAIGGDELAKMGFCGRQIGEILSELLMFVIEHPEQNQKQILSDMAKKYR